MTPELERLWVFLAASPLLSLTITLLAFQFSAWLVHRLRAGTYLHPVLVSMAILIGFLLVTDTSYQTYFEGAQFVHFLLGPATVALAVPLYDNFARVRRVLKPLTVACLVGSITAALSAVAVGLALNASQETILSLAPKSVTSPIAMGIADKLGGLPALTAALVLVTGSIGCITAPWLFRLLRIRDETVKGFTLGLSAHGFGTAQAFTISPLAGAFAGLGIGFAGVVTAFLLPLIIRLLGI